MAPGIEEILRDVRVADVKPESASPVSPSTTLGEVYRLLDEGSRGAVVVCEGDRIVGIFTERDVLYRTSLEGIDLDTPISELMTRDPESVPVTTRLADAVRAMTEGGFRHLPLDDGDGCCAGILTSRDVLRFLADHFSEAVLNLPPRLHQRMRRPEGG